MIPGRSEDDDVSADMAMPKRRNRVEFLSHDCDSFQPVTKAASYNLRKYFQNRCPGCGPLRMYFQKDINAQQHTINIIEIKCELIPSNRTGDCNQSPVFSYLGVVS
jgi:hypothetical protein